jgi:putative N6-adenine-specific DNA methylase
VRGLRFVCTEEPGGVALQGDAAALARLNLGLRTATRVLVRLGAFEAKSFGALVHEAGKLPFERVLRPGQPVALRVTCKKSKLYHSDAVAERVLAAIGARLGKPAPLAAGAGDDDSPQPEAQGAPAQTAERPAPAQTPPAQLLVVRFDHDRCTVSADSSGALLHRRGYRTHLSQAPLRETLGAALLLAAGYAGGPLLDPCCGAGTLPLEGALLALGRPPGLQRRFACEAWPGFDSQIFAKLRAEAGQRPLPASLPISGSDLDPRAVAAAWHNADAAGLGALVRFSERALQDLALPAGLAPGATGLVACNPPYGMRVGEGSHLRALYAALGKAVRERLPGWRLALVCADDALALATGTLLTCAARTENGGTKVGLWVQTPALLR